MDHRRRDIALFGYSLIREAADARLSHRERVDDPSLGGRFGRIMAAPR